MSEVERMRAENFAEYENGSRTPLVYRDTTGRRVSTEIPVGAELDLSHPAVQEAANKVLAYRRERDKADRSENRKRKAARKRARLGLSAQPQQQKWRAISTGQYRRHVRPQTSPSDRDYVPAALKHWRTIHGLSYREAQERIGYSGSSSSWSHWENGFVAPPYLTLLKIISVTGLGFWVDPENRMGIDPSLRLDADRNKWATGMRRRRVKQRARESAAGQLQQ
jgi:transcriptional regulator with XRE-family HTH domain